MGMWLRESCASAYSLSSDAYEWASRWIAQSKTLVSFEGILLLPTPSRLTHNGQVDGLPNLELWGSFEAILLLPTPCSSCSTRLTNGQVDGLPNLGLWGSLEGILLLPTPSGHVFQNNINFDQIYI